MMIRILPHIPNFQYLYTCPNCGCHIASTWKRYFNPQKPIRVKCWHCDEIYPWKEQNYDQETQTSTNTEESPEDEIKKAIQAIIQE